MLFAFHETGCPTRCLSPSLYRPELKNDVVILFVGMKTRFLSGHAGCSQPKGMNSFVLSAILIMSFFIDFCQWYFSPNPFPCTLTKKSGTAIVHSRCYAAHSLWKCSLMVEQAAHNRLDRGSIPFTSTNWFHERLVLAGFDLGIVGGFLL